MNRYLSIWQQYKTFIVRKFQLLKDQKTTETKEQHNCVFCSITQNRIIAENDFCLAIKDGFPVTKDHALIIPKRHVSDFFDLKKMEMDAVLELLNKVKVDTVSADPAVSGFNIGVNIGESAGQTIFHCHIHLIPRRNGDVENPRGGVRGVIPAKQSY